MDFGRSCARHQGLLVAFIDRGEVRPGTSAALSHLDRCDRCTEAIESTMLTITALRRLGDAAQGAEPRPDAWPRLRVRLQSLRPRGPAPDCRPRPGGAYPVARSASARGDVTPRRDRDERRDRGRPRPAVPPRR